MGNSVRNVGGGVIVSDNYRNSNSQTSVQTRAEQPDLFRPSVTGYQERLGIDGGNFRKAALNAEQTAQSARTAAPRMDAASERELARLNPQLAERVRLMAADLRAQGINVVVAPKGGLRTFAEQNELYAQGRTKPGNIVTNVRGGGSYHNYGLAVDIVPTTASGQPTWNASADTWNRIGRAGEQQGLEWGGRWTSFQDRPHFQMAGGTSSATQLLSTYNNGGLPAVWNRVNQRYPPVGGTVPGNPPTTPTNPTTPTTPSLPVPTANLERGSRGAQVKQLQTALVKLGYMTQAEMNTGQGIFGPRTERALREFQRDHKDVIGRQLAADGDYGPLTRGALGRALSGTSSAAPTAAALPVPTASLQRGSTGEQVKQLQNALVQLKYLTRAEVNTGYGTFGPKTEQAVKDFQRDKGIEQLGIYGPKTQAALRQALGQTGTPPPPTTPTNPTNPGTVTPETLIRVPGSQNVSREFKQKTIDIAGRLGMDPNHLMSIMSFESGLNPRAVNGASGATGLIQFLPSTARGLGTTVADLKNMSAERQLDFVEKYLSPYKNRMRTIEDAYMAVFQPVAIGKPNSAVLFSRGSTAYSQNSALDIDRNGSITKGEAATYVRKIYNDAIR